MREQKNIGVKRDKMSVNTFPNRRHFFLRMERMTIFVHQDFQELCCPGFENGRARRGKRDCQSLSPSKTVGMV